MAVLTGKILYPPYRVAFTPSPGQRIFNIASGDIGGQTDINNAQQITMYADGVLVQASDHNITGALQITSDDPQTGDGTGWTANSIEFFFTFI